jgi:hypothetical protein
MFVGFLRASLDKFILVHAPHQITIFLMVHAHMSILDQLMAHARMPILDQLMAHAHMPILDQLMAHAHMPILDQLLNPLHAHMTNVLEDYLTIIHYGQIENLYKLVLAIVKLLDLFLPVELCHTDNGDLTPVHIQEV